MSNREYKNQLFMRKSLFVILLFLLVLSSSLATMPFVYYNILLLPIIGVISFYVFVSNFYMGPLLVFCFSFISLFSTFLIDSSLDKIVYIFYSSFTYSLIYVLLTIVGSVIGYIIYNVFDSKNFNNLKKINVTIIIIVITFGIIYITNAFVGNPISSLIARNTAQYFIDNNNDDYGYYVDKIDFNFEDKEYTAFIKSNLFIDGYFEINYNSFGKEISSSYGNLISGKNTYDRINLEYKNLVEKAIENTSFYDVNHKQTATLNILGDSEIDKYMNNNFGLVLDDLVFNKQYNLEKMGALYGRLVIYIETDDISSHNMSLYLLAIKEELNNFNVLFNSVDLTLYNSLEKSSTNVVSFKKDDIFEENLETRVVSYIEKYEEIKNNN